MQHPAPAGFRTTIVTTSELRARGISRRSIAAFVADDRLRRVRNGRFVAADVPHPVEHAARLGGRLDCLSLLRVLGVFVRDHGPLHIQVTNGSSRLPRRPSGVVAHWRETQAGPEDLLADVVEALVQSCRCQDLRAAIASLDSAWHLGIVDDAGIAEVFARLPRRMRRLRLLLDKRSESGPETLVRLMLRGLGCDVDVQVEIDGVGRVDFVVDGWLIVECDSKAHHSDWESQLRDRRRDLAAAALGFTTVRPVAEDILYRPETVLTALRAALAHRPRTATGPNSSKKARPLAPAAS